MWGIGSQPRNSAVLAVAIKMAKYRLCDSGGQPGSWKLGTMYGQAGTPSHAWPCCSTVSINFCPLVAVWCKITGPLVENNLALAPPFQSVFQSVFRSFLPLPSQIPLRLKWLSGVRKGFKIPLMPYRQNCKELLYLRFPLHEVRHTEKHLQPCTRSPEKENFHQQLSANRISNPNRLSSLRIRGCEGRYHPEGS